MTTNEHDEFHEARHDLVDRLERAGHLHDQNVIEAMRTVPRHVFVPSTHEYQAYRDAPVGIGHGQTISAPHMVAMMLDPARLTEGDNVLEVGAGSGYLAAVTAEVIGPTGHVTAVEIVPDLARRAEDVLTALDYDNIEVVVADGSLGYSRNAPYDAIIVSAAAPDVPPPLPRQLADDGRIIIPVGDRDGQFLTLLDRGPDGQLTKRALQPCRFVPLIGEHGW